MKSPRWNGFCSAIQRRPQQGIRKGAFLKHGFYQLIISPKTFVLKQAFATYDFIPGRSGITLLEFWVLCAVKIAQRLFSYPVYPVIRAKIITPALKLDFYLSVVFHRLLHMISKLDALWIQA